MNETTARGNPEATGNEYAIVKTGVVHSIQSALTHRSAKMLSIGCTGLAAAALGLAVLGFVTGDFALNWQPVPPSIPGRTTLAYLTAGLFTVLGAGLLIDRNKVNWLVALAAAFLVWALLLHGPGVVAAPLDVLPWLGFTERLEVAAGALMLAAAWAANASFARWSASIGRICFGASLPIFGFSHFAYAQFTADMIPDWIPAPLFWAYFTGAGHVAAGISILTNVLARLGSFLFAVMVSIFVLALHLPGVIGDTGSRVQWTMLVIATTIAAAAWCTAGCLARPVGRH